MTQPLPDLPIPSPLLAEVAGQNYPQSALYVLATPIGNAGDISLRVIPLPGACAATTALSAAGLLQDQFHFIGFLPAKAGQRDTLLAGLRGGAATLVFYEAPHRIVDTVHALAAAFEPERRIIFA